MHNVHEAAPAVFESRWTHVVSARSALARPDQALTVERREPSPAPAAGGVSRRRDCISRSGEARTGRVARRRAAGRSPWRPGVLPAGEGPRRRCLRARHPRRRARRFSDRALGVDTTRDVLYLAPVTDDAIQVDWARAWKLDMTPADLRARPGTIARLCAAAGGGRVRRRNTPPGRRPSPGGWRRTSASSCCVIRRWPHVRRRIGARLPDPPAARTARGPGRGGRGRAAEVRAEAGALAERLRRAEQAVDREQQQASDQKLQTAVSMGATVLGALFGRKAVSIGTLGRATTAARGVGRTMKEDSDVKRAARASSPSGGRWPRSRTARRRHRGGHRAGSTRTSRSSASRSRPSAARSRCSSSRWPGPPTAAASMTVARLLSLLLAAVILGGAVRPRSCRAASAGGARPRTCGARPRPPSASCHRHPAPWRCRSAPARSASRSSATRAAAIDGSRKSPGRWWPGGRSFPSTFVLMLGDNIYGGQHAADYERKFEEPYRALLDAA